MKNQQLTKPVIVKAGMLVRKPLEKVFEAFINPENHDEILVHEKHRQIRDR